MMYVWLCLRLNWCIQSHKTDVQKLSYRFSVLSRTYKKTKRGETLSRNCSSPTLSIWMVGQQRPLLFHSEDQGFHVVRFRTFTFIIKLIIFSVLAVICWIDQQDGELKINLKFWKSCSEDTHISKLILIVIDIPSFNHRLLPFPVCWRLRPESWKCQFLCFRLHKYECLAASWGQHYGLSDPTIMRRQLCRQNTGYWLWL